jgi:hypothetical protein
MLIATPTSNCNKSSSKTIFQWKRKKKSKVTPSYKLHLLCFKKTHVQTIGIQVQNTQNNHMFLLCVSEFQKMKDDIPKPHHGDKPPNTTKPKSLSVCSKI